MIALLTLLAEEGEAAAEAAPPNPVIPELNELVWAAIFFFVLWALMRYVLLPPIQAGMQTRRDKMNAERDAADRARDDLGRVRSDYQAALADARAEANRLIEEARARVDEQKAALAAEADAEIATWRREAAAEIDRARESAIADMRDDVAELAVAAASAVLGRPLDVAANRAVVDRALAGNTES